jgi:hypothetical protein
MTLTGLVLLGKTAVSLRGGPYSVPDGTTIQEHLTGRWDWANHTRLCVDSTHTIEFRDGGRVMAITQQQQWVDSTGRDRTTAVYDVFSQTKSKIRGQIRGEERLTESGEPVVWDLVLFGPNEYRWHRADWSSLGFTGRIIRCIDGEPSDPAEASPRASTA